MTAPETYQLKWHSHNSHIHASVASLLRSERFTDVVLCTMDGAQVPAHKFILSSCSVYLSGLFDGQRSVSRMAGVLYIVLPSEISSRALKVLVEYMYRGETTVSKDILDTVLKAGEVLKIRGLWRQADDIAQETASFEKHNSVNYLNKQHVTLKKTEESQVAKKDDKIIQLGQIQQQPGTRPMFIGPPKLVFIKTGEGGSTTNLRPIAPKGQTIMLTQEAIKASTSAKSADKETPVVINPKITRRPVPDRSYGKKAKVITVKTKPVEIEKPNAMDTADSKSGDKSSSENNINDGKITIKEEPEWDASSIEEEERSIAEIFQNVQGIKTEPGTEESDDETLMYSPLTCELCAEVFTLPGAWVRHVQGHNVNDANNRKRKLKEEVDDSDELALLRCDLCQKHFLDPGEWVRHIQSTHTESELAISNQSALPKRHNRFTEGEQNKKCRMCKKLFPSHASMLIHMRTHTGERPFVCGVCNKGFNVKSNLLRHLRTLHEQSGDLEEAVLSPEETPPAAKGAS